MSKYCPSCGTEHNDSARFCGNCGAAFPDFGILETTEGNELHNIENNKPLKENNENSELNNNAIDVGFDVETGDTVNNDKYDLNETEVTNEDTGAFNPVGELCGEKYKITNKARIFKNKKVLFGIATPVIAVIVILIILFSFNIINLSDKSAKCGIFINYNDDTLYVAYGKECKSVEFDNKITYISYRTSFDEKYAAVAVKTKDGNYLYYYDNGDIKEISDELFYYEDFLISTNGSMVYYLKKYSGEQYCDLFVFENGESKSVAADVDYDFCISPDGSVAGYTVWNDKNDSCTGYVYDGKHITELGKNIRPVALSNGAKYIYFEKNDNIYVQSKYNEDTRVKIGTDCSTLGLNDDGTECILICENETKLVKSGDSEYVIGDDYDLADYYTIVGNYINNSYSDESSYYWPISVVIDVNHYTGACFECYDASEGEYTIKFLKKSGEAEKIATKIIDYYITNDGEYLLYLKKDSIYKIKIDSNNDPEEVVSGNVDELVAISGDGDTVFYFDDDDEFYVKKGEKSPVYISDYYDMDDYDYELFQGKLFYFVEDGELYCINNLKKEHISAPFSTDIDSIYVYSNMIIVYTEDGVYYSSDGTNFIEVWEE